jgi:hypothetical protein
VQNVGVKKAAGLGWRGMKKPRAGKDPEPSRSGRQVPERTRPESSKRVQGALVQQQGKGAALAVVVGPAAVEG